MGKYCDNTANIQVLGAVFLKPEIIDDNRYKFILEDFVTDLHQVILGSIYNLHLLGAKSINIQVIEDYLLQRPQHYGTYKSGKGADFLKKLSTSTQIDAFDYYYNRMKKMTLLRNYNEIVGMDLSSFYDTDNLFDVKKKQRQEEWLDNHSLQEIADAIDDRIYQIRSKFVESTQNDEKHISTSIYEMLEKLKESPDVGYPLYGRLINAVHRGARLSKFYLRSAVTGLGKTRTMIADACTVACPELYDITTHEWVKNGTAEPVVYIATEQKLDEIQRMCLAFVAHVPEEHIQMGNYVDDEWERVLRAAKILGESNFQMKELPDFTMQTIENTIKHMIRNYDTKYVFYDYIHTSLGILSEVSSRARGVQGLREDNILFMISTKLKDICNEYNVFIISSTQLNAEYRDTRIYDQNLLRGAKAIADKLDFGAIMLHVDDTDREVLPDLTGKLGCEMPTIKMSIYKNRGSKYNYILLWCKKDLDVCRIDPMFATDYQYNYIPIEDLQINVV